MADASKAMQKRRMPSRSNGLVAKVYDQGIQKLVTCYDKCLKVDGDYAEKNLRVCNSDILNLFLLFIFLRYKIWHVRVKILRLK